MKKVFDYFQNKPHIVTELICLKCLNRYIGVYPEERLLKELYCDYCQQKGFIIKTGQDLETE